MHLGEIHEATKSTSSTWHNVPESDGGEGDEAKVEGSEEAPILPLFRLSLHNLSVFYQFINLSFINLSAAVCLVSYNYWITDTRLLDLQYHLCMCQLIPG